ncbi:MAG: hypothetical protein GF350_15195 [Chitinivibrionales bacterium]|nr:hypothetical protein [Chitinivibrionales bacterium]
MRKLIKRSVSALPAALLLFLLLLGGSCAMMDRQVQRSNLKMIEEYRQEQAIDSLQAQAR